MSEQLPHVCFVALRAYPLLTGNDEIQVIGGAELQQVTVARCLAAKGYPVSMVCLDYGQEQQVTVDGIRVVRAFRPDEGVPVLRFLWPRMTSVWACLKQVDADIYYQRTADMWTGIMVKFCKNHGKRSIFAAAGNPDLEKPTSRIRRARDRWIYAYGLRHVDRIFVQNDEQARLCRTNFDRQSMHVPNCYPIPTIRSQAVDHSILWVSTIRELKRPGLFLDLAEALPAIQFRMIGGPGHGEAALFESIKARAEKIPNLQFLGFVPYSKIDEQFDRAMIFVNTSDSEGFPNTFLQAWARRIPTVSFIDAGARMDGRPVGLRVNSFDDMVGTVAALVSNDSDLLREGQRCEAHFRGSHSPDKVVGHYQRVFKELMTPGSPRGPWQGRQTVSI